MNIFIDGQKLGAQKGETIMQVAKAAGIEIPALCHHEALPPVGACRLCTVEITHEKWNGWKGMVTSCLYPVEDGLEVFTDSERVLRLRQTVLSLLAARCPESEVICNMAEKHGKTTSYKNFEDGSKCIMCYTCVRVCEKMGANAIAAVNRGTKKIIAPPFGEEATSCIGCGSCALSCPTGNIELTDTVTERKIWGRTFDFVLCEHCNEPVITTQYKDYLVEKYALLENYYTICPKCKHKKTAELFEKVGK